MSEPKLAPEFKQQAPEPIKKVQIKFECVMIMSTPITVYKLFTISC